ncbi:hypothetical protein PHLCEN_2v4596 [Hermanssonia centrifuga]|uniref:Protein kinase domain-containing protein n=1 Tax=Hermanssonia centrifuga TaxID=98765 RepID=A0A2R6PN23_9APHY|nr:hypothetical protein PHLCEN_2v4596 [Hermanssonia centrifuga]
MGKCGDITPPFFEKASFVERIVERDTRKYSSRLKLILTNSPTAKVSGGHIIGGSSAAPSRGASSYAGNEATTFGVLENGQAPKGIVVTTGQRHSVSASPPSLPSPGVGARRKGQKSSPKLPPSAFTPPNAGTSDQFLLAPSPSSIQPVKIIDAHVVAQNGDLIKRENSLQLIQDVFGNYVVQKLFEAMTDFGLATTDRMSTEFRTECQGAEIAPLSNDIWSLGIILLNLIMGRNHWKPASPDDCTFQAYLKDPRHFLSTVLPISNRLAVKSIKNFS